MPVAKPLTHQERCKLFGRFAFKPLPLPGDAEHIVITDGWDRENLVKITLPWQERGAWVHRLIAEQTLGLWRDWADAGLLDRVLSFNGAFVARYKRGRSGGEENLSNHSWGTAFDINAKWNRLGHPPAQLGTTGCIIELLPFCQARGFLNGSTFGGGRIDAQHFEAYRVIPSAPEVA
jgi:hypothetical protein